MRNGIMNALLLLTLGLSFYIVTHGVTAEAAAATKNDFDRVLKENPFASLEVTPEMERALHDATNKVQDMINDHIIRKLQDQPPPPFSPSRGCGDVITTTTIEEIKALLTVFINAAIPPESPLAGGASIALTSFFMLLKYDIKAVKVCMSCNEAAALLAPDVANNAEPVYGFQSYCGTGLYGADDVQQSALALFPIDPDTGDFIQGTSRGLMAGHGTEFSLYFSQSENWPSDFITYLDQIDIGDLLYQQGDRIAPSVYASAGAVAIFPDYIGFGESYQSDRTYGVKQNYAQAFTLGYLAAQEYYRSASNGCSDLEPAFTITGYSEGAYSGICGALALRELGVEILNLYSGGGPFSPEIGVGWIYELYMPDSAPLDNITAILGRAVGPYYGYAYSNENPFLANTGTDQYMLTEEYRTGDITNNALLWFKSPVPLGAGYIGLAPIDPTQTWNDDLRAIYEMALNASEYEGCNFANNVTDKICEAFRQSDLRDDLVNKVDFNMTVCHSPDDRLVPPFMKEFALANPLATEYSGVAVGPQLVLGPEGDHSSAQVACAIPPVWTLQVPSPNPPVKNTPLENPPSVCTAGPTSAPMMMPTPTMDTPTMDDPTDTPTTSSAASVLVHASFFVSSLIFSFTLL